MWKSEVGFWITIFTSNPIQFFSKAEERANLRFRHFFQKLLSWLILHWARLRKWQKYICVNRFLAVKSLPVENCCGMYSYTQTYSENARSERRLWWGSSEGRFFSGRLARRSDRKTEEIVHRIARWFTKRITRRIFTPARSTKEKLFFRFWGGSDACSWDHPFRRHASEV